ncbi:MAG TPA: LysM peptidoglycan-binding domain-containing protein, partial [Dehalococcoidia bacterium]|nr:LysM peptidoglycan-binding domain-containing protein [Dehalococcoidia bacterium]
MAPTPAPPQPEDAQYLRAPVALDGVNQARIVGVPIQGQSAAVIAGAPAQAADAAQVAPATPTPSDAAQTAPTPSPTPIPTDTPEQPNDPSQVVSVPDPSRNDPVTAEDRAAALQELAQPLYYDHVVQPGDTVSTIAARYGISVDTVVWNNPLITDPNQLFVGQTLRIPATNGVLYDVHLGDTLQDIADQHGVDPKAVLSLAANGLADASQIREGQTILIVGGKPPAPPAPA